MIHWLPQGQPRQYPSQCSITTAAAFGPDPNCQLRYRATAFQDLIYCRTVRVRGPSTFQSINNSRDSIRFHASASVDSEAQSANRLPLSNPVSPCIGSLLVFAPFPSGPAGLPFIGNILNFPRAKPWVVFGRIWGMEHGRIMSARLWSQVYIIINDFDVAVELLSKRGNIYANRPTSIMLELANYHHGLAAEPYGQRFRDYRKLLSRVLGSRTAVRRYQDVGEYHTTRLLQHLLKLQPGGKDTQSVIHKAIGEFALHITYGYIANRDLASEDPFMVLAEQAQSQFATLTAPGRYMVEYFPFLRYLPTSAPFAGFKRLAASCSETSRLFHDLPYQYTQRHLEAGDASSSFVADVLSDEDAVDREYVKWVAGSFYGGTSDTTTTALSAFCIAMCLHPEIQHRLHAEIDEVTGGHRLPTYGDRPNLPYAEAVIKEVLRWLPIAPLALPHCVTQDDYYGGYYIPQNSIVLTNCWAMQHDEKAHPEPSIFKPERFLGPNPERDPAKEVFGFGRRSCPGLHLADMVIFIAIVKIAAAFNIKVAIGLDGQLVMPSHDTDTNGPITLPDAFPCTWEARLPNLGATLSKILDSSRFSHNKRGVTNENDQQIGQGIL
ncbi:unnamed protein product [Peniophora sp. CBMAI 1063]|nr:unnamed protein product [Peniophora sp. CBMAI 1063]